MFPNFPLFFSLRARGLKRRQTEKGYYGEKEQHSGEELAGEASVLAKLLLKNLMMKIHCTILVQCLDLNEAD